MTYLELAKKCDAASLVKLLDNTHYGCRQAMGKTREEQNEIWRKLCRSSEYRDEDGCRRCRIDFWDSEVQDGRN
jgi:hypothetical protein